LVPTIGVVLLAFASVEALGRAVPGPDGGASSQDLAIVYVWCAALALASHGLLVSLRQWSKHPAVARGGTYLVFGGIVMFVTQNAVEARTNLGPGLVACAILGATTLPLVLRRPRGGSNLLVAVLLAIWIVPPLPALWHVWNTWSIGGLVALLVCSKIGDTAGYYVGTAIGRHHPFPRISPGKTTEGCLGSLAAGTLAGGAFVAFGLLPGDIVQGLMAGAVANLAAQSGDLLESFVKRRVGVKDSSGMFGPSGGLLDQLDSLLVSIPAAVLVWPWILPVGAGSH
jgi:CDP-diglyceride synthetase